MDHDNYKVSVNGGEVMDGSLAFEIGNYNALMMDCPAYKKCRVILLTIFPNSFFQLVISALKSLMHCSGDHSRMGFRGRFSKCCQVNDGRES